MTPQERLAVLIDRQEDFRAFLARRTRSSTDAEDLLQEALLKATATVRTVRDDASIVPWFYRVLRNALAELCRRRRLHDLAGRSPRRRRLTCLAEIAEL